MTNYSFLKNLFSVFSASTNTVTHFEELPNEIFHEVFGFLDYRYVYDAFIRLNSRFDSLLNDPTLSINLDLSSMDRKTFEKYCNDILIPNTHRVQSLLMTNPISIDFFLRHENILAKFTRLKTFILNNNQSVDIEQLLHHFISLPRLSSLVISVINHGGITNNVYEAMFHLPSLKYCKITTCYPHKTDSPLPIATNQFSPIEYLVIDDYVSMSEFNALVSYVPQLRRLRLAHLWRVHDGPMIPCAVQLHHLTHVSLNDMRNIMFDEVESMITNLFLHVQVLDLELPSDRTYLNAQRWERLILSHMPHLTIFKIYSEINDKSIDSTDDPKIKAFRSSFWLERNWLFTSVILREWYYDSRLLFYSKPCR